MFCPKCGAQNDDHVYHCGNCGSPVRPEPTYENAPVADGGVYTPPGNLPKPSNWLIPAIFSTVFCMCWPLGVVAIVFAAQVDGKYHHGDYLGAQSAASKARLFTILNMLFGVLCIGSLGLLQFFGLLAAILQEAGR